MWIHWNPCTLLVEILNGAATVEKWQFFKKLNEELPYDPAIPFLGM